MTARALIYRDQSLREPASLDELDAVRRDPDALLWLDLARPEAADLALLRDEFEFHPLAIEDVERAEMRAKLDSYDGYSLMVLFDLSMEAQAIHVSELKLFVGQNYIVSVHHAPIHSLEELRVRWLREPQLVQPHPLSLLLHQIADGLIDDYFPIVDAIDERLADVEERLFDGAAHSALADIFALRKQLIQGRRLIAQMRDVFNVLSRREQPFFDERTVPYFTDVYDHLLRLSDTLEMQRDLVTGALETYLSIQSNQLNQTMRTLTAVTLIVMVPTLIAGVYGMNFRHMPELDWPYGYPLAIALMLLVAVGLLGYFRRAGWL